MKTHITNENALSGYVFCCYRLRCHFIPVCIWLWWTCDQINERIREKMAFDMDHMNDWLSASLEIIWNVHQYYFFGFSLCWFYLYTINGFNSCVIHVFLHFRWNDWNECMQITEWDFDTHFFEHFYWRLKSCIHFVKQY